MRSEIKLNLESRPNLMSALNAKDTTKETLKLIGLFMDLAEESLSTDKPIRWVDLPGKFHKDLTFEDTIKGILRGALDVHEINEDNFDTLGADVHPFALFTVREPGTGGGLKTNYSKWREHFQVEGKPGEESITQIMRNMLRYSRYLNFKLIFENMKADWQVNSIYRGMGAEHVKRLPFYPALKYQENLYGELGGVGKFFDDIGAFDCGEIPEIDRDVFNGNAVIICYACGIGELEHVGDYGVCPHCNAGFK